MEVSAVSEEKTLIENEPLFTPNPSDSTVEIIDEDALFEEFAPSSTATDSSAAPSGTSAAQPDSSGQSETPESSSTAFGTDPTKTSSRRFFRSRKAEAFSRDQLILSRISDEDLMEYIRLEAKRSELIHDAKEKRNKRFMTAFMLTVSLIAIVTVVYLLKDNPAILVNILYIAGLLTAFWFWKKK